MTSLVLNNWAQKKDQISLCIQTSQSRPQGYKTFFMLNSAQQIFSANKNENANNS